VLLASSAAWFWLSGRRRDAEAASLLQDRHSRLIKWGARLGHPLGKGQTLREYGTSLGDSLHARGQASRWAVVRRAGRDAPREVEGLVRTFNRALYSQAPVLDRDAWRVRDRWLRLHPNLWWLWLGGRRR
jgi:hypothetical protein